MNTDLEKSITKLRSEQLIMQYPNSKERIKKLIAIAKKQKLTNFKILEFIKSITGLTYSEIKNIIKSENVSQLLGSAKKDRNDLDNVKLF